MRFENKTCNKKNNSIVVFTFFLCMQVNIWVPQPERQLDVIKVTGLAPNVERAKLGLQERVKELQAEQEDRVHSIYSLFLKNHDLSSKAKLSNMLT